MKVGAFLDIDGTLYRGSLMIQHFKKLIKYEVLDPVIWHNQVKNTYTEWKRRKGFYEDYLEELAEIYINELKGMKISNLEFINDQVINLSGDIVYRYTRHIVNYHLDKNHKVFFISGSPEFLVKKMAKKYNITDFKGSEYLLDDNGHFTGEVIKMWKSNNKEKILNQFVNNYNIDLEKSYSYGDTQGDYSMLKMTGNPIAFNPNYDLLTTIKKDENLKEKIKVIIERKDNIYKVDPEVEVLYVN
ncbi:MAG: HAD-IB family hydrolase [Halanaerobiales bacterium]